MVIDNLQRIRAIERAMRDVIIPALDPKMANAIEQAGYVVGHLALLAEHNNWEYPFALAEMRDFLDLTASLQRIVGDAAPEAVTAVAGSATRGAEPLAPLRIPPLSTVKDHILRLRQAADELLMAALDGPPELRNAAAAEVFRVAARREERDGAWNRGAGYDTGAADLTSLLDV
jgi:hypothetical protein